MGYLGTWIEYLKGKATGDQPLFEIVPHLYISPEIRDVAKIQAAGIAVVIDLEGSFDPAGLADGLVHYFYWPIVDAPRIPPMAQLARVAIFAAHCLEAGLSVLVH